MNRKKIYLELELKKALLCLPKMLIAFVITALVFAMAVFGVTKIQESNEKLNENFKVALVVYDDDKYTDIAISFLLEEESVKELCTFIKMPEEEAIDQLMLGEVGAVVIIPQQFLVGILNGNNIPARIVLRDKDNNSSSVYFRELIDAATTDLATAQSAVYALSDLCRATGIDAIEKSGDYLNRTLLFYALGRNSYYEYIDVSQTGDIPLDIFYISGGIVLLMLCLGIICREIANKDSSTMIDMLEKNGIKPTYIFITKFIGAMLVYTIIFLPIYIIYTCFIAKTTVSFIGIIALLTLIFTSVSYGMLMLWLIENATAASLGIFGIALGMMFLSGNIIPSVFMGRGVNAVGKVVPTGYMSKLCGQILISSVNIYDMVICVGFGVAFIMFAIIYTTVGKGEKRI